MFGTGEREEVFFQSGDVWSHDELSAFENAGESGGEFGFERMVLGVDVEERNHGEKEEETWVMCGCGIVSYALSICE